MIAQLPHLGVDVGVIGDQRTAIPERAEILLNDEADGSGIAELTDPEAFA